MKHYLLVLVSLLFITCSSPKNSEKIDNEANRKTHSDTIESKIQEIDTMQADQTPITSSEDYWELYRSNPSKRPFFNDRISYQIQLTMTADTILSESDDFHSTERIIGGLTWNLDEAYRIVTSEMSLTETIAESSEEDAFEASNNLVYVTFYYDSAQNVEYVNFNDLLAKNNESIFWGKIDDKTAFPLEFNLDVPDLLGVLKAIDWRSFNFNQNTSDPFHDYKIESANLKSINPVAVSYMNGYLELRTNLMESINEASNWFNRRMYYKSGSLSPINFKKGRALIRTTKGDLNLIKLIDHIFKKTDYLKIIQDDTVQYFYWTSVNGTNVRAKSIWPVVRIGNQEWLAVNYGYVYPKQIKGHRYPFKSIGKICPEGWHIPSKPEWETLIQYLGGGVNAAKALISNNPMYWTHSQKDFNSTGFNAIQFSQQSKGAKFLTSTEISEDKMVVVSVIQEEGAEPEILFEDGFKSHSYSCRCIKD